MHIHDEKNLRNLPQLHADLQDYQTFQNAAAIFKLLSDCTRLRLFWLLCHREECVANLAELLEMSSPAVAHHLRLLSDGGLLTCRRDGKEVYYKVSPTIQGNVLHKLVEQVMNLACPDEGQLTLIQEVHDYLLEHLDQHISIEELAQHFYVNPTSLKETFKKVYGTSLAAHIKEHRLETAARLLRSSQDPISAIAKAVGYTSASRFSEAFRETYHCLPREYRKKKKE